MTRAADDAVRQVGPGSVRHVRGDAGPSHIAFSYVLLFNLPLTLPMRQSAPGSVLASPSLMLFHPSSTGTTRPSHPSPPAPPPTASTASRQSFSPLSISGF